MCRNEHMLDEGVRPSKQSGMPGSEDHAEGQGCGVDIACEHYLVGWFPEWLIFNKSQTS